MRGIAGQLRNGRRRPRPDCVCHGRARDRQDYGRRRVSRSTIRQRKKPHRRAWTMLGASGRDRRILAAARSSVGLIRGQGGEDVGLLMERTAPSWRGQIAPFHVDRSVQSEKKAASLEQMKWELKAFFHELSLRHPVVLFLDDLHWSDISTIDLISFLGGKFDQIRILIVSTYRSSEMLLARSPFVQVKLDFQSRGLCHEIAL